MKKTISILMLVTALSLSACDHMSHQQQRALSGGAIGGAAGLGIGLLTGAPLAGALIGGAGGAALGAVSHSH